MAFKINIKEAFNWPAKLARAIDVDGAFRLGALLAAMRVIAPRMTGDGFERQFEKSENYAPDFAPADAYNVDAYRVMGALFEWDGGESYIVGNYTQPGDVFSLSPVKAGELVFQDVWERGPADGSSSGYGIEKMAKRGEVHSCFASAFPYRYWWQAFNRAVYQLTQAFPLLTKSEDEYRILPYSFSVGPNGEAVMTPDDLCTGWVSAEEAKELVKVPGDKAWLVTAEDIDFSGVFCTYQEDDRRNELRSQWATLASIAGFWSYIAEDSFVERLKFKDGIENYWRGETPPKYGSGLLAQLSTDWRGRANSWRDEFPYHGLSSLLAYLSYFERQNLGFAITCSGVDRIRSIDHDVKDWSAQRKVTLNISTSLYSSTPEKIEYKIKELGWSDVETTLRESVRSMNPEAGASVSFGQFSAWGLLTGSPLTFYVTELGTHDGMLEAWCDGDGNPFEQFLNGGAAAMEEELNRRAREAITDGAEEAEGTLTVEVLCQGFSSLTLPDTRGEDAGKVYPKWDSIQPDNFPFIPWDYSMESNRYFGIKTSHSSAVVKSGNFNICARLKNEAGITEATELLPILPNPATDEGEVTIELTRPDKMFYVEENPNNPMMSFLVDLPGQPMERVQKPMPSIFADDGSGLKQIFPPQPEEIGEHGIRLDYLVPASHVEVTVRSQRPEDEEDPSFRNYSRLEELTSLTFVRYAENVIYPDR